MTVESAYKPLLDLEKNSPPQSSSLVLKVVAIKLVLFAGAICIGYVPLSLNVAVVIGTIAALLWPQSREEPQKIMIALQPPKKSAPRQYYLDTLKALCTFLVLMTHVLMGYGGGAVAPGAHFIGFVIGNHEGSIMKNGGSVIIDLFQSFYMCLFFFISGCFTPQSLEKKGIVGFAKDRFTRLGLPFLVFTFILCPSMRILTNEVLFDSSLKRPLFYNPSNGPLWFAGVLLIFSMLYAYPSGLNISMALPPLWALLLGGAVLGFFEWVAVIVAPMTVGGVPLMVPWGVPNFVMGGIVFDIAFFYAGCLAAKNGWLSEITSFKGMTLWTVRIVMLVFFLLNTYPAFAGKVAPVIRCSMYGVQTVATSLCLIHFFAAHFNGGSAFSRFLSNGAYGVYILHPAVWPIVSYSYVKILEACDFEHLSFTWNQPKETVVSTVDGLSTMSVFPSSSTYLPNSALVFGYVFTVLLSAAILWPLANSLRKLRGLRNIL
mmetsp:Transcript_6329/g.10683  ORF Transcript_6329/g.10683 Transcript_6329/m.10683 type:complete len:488 (+) Transcript_6329:94-1557(+)